VATNAATTRRKEAATDGDNKMAKENGAGKMATIKWLLHTTPTENGADSSSDGHVGDSALAWASDATGQVVIFKGKN